MEFPNLSGQVAVITGASRGIGKNIALRLARAGADIVVAAKSERSRESLPGSIHETVAEVEALGRQALAVKTDVRDADQIKNMIDAALERFGRIDILLNNAGALHWRSVVETPPKRYDLMMDVNARAAFIASHYALPHMLERGSGTLIQMSPPIDLRMLPGKTGYCMSKFGMSLLAMGMGAEVRDTEIKSCALWPATAIESQATINHQLGGPAQWRKADILADAVGAILAADAKQVNGKCLVDEDVLKLMGVDDFEPYNCVAGGKPIRIIGDGGVDASLWQS
ncbi:MAG: citronellol/citronellal dehydrogenase [Myxococcota bacterium]|jgi:citronellol/citronellal dehydrogenase